VPYDPHPLFGHPSADTKIWRYMDFTKFVSLLATRKLYFSNIESLSASDPFEGLYTRHNLEAERQFLALAFDKLPEEARRAFSNEASWANFVRHATLGNQRDFAKKQRRLTYVNCWHISSHQSAAMWKIYLKSDEGIAIQSTVGHLIESLKDENESRAFYV
jgi:hypothetical protein